jgi:phenylacetate-coenzyme A ligase PaaK-like adenylate-forming protein
MQTPDRADLLPMLANLQEANFEATAQAVFAYQAAHNPLLAQYLKLLGYPTNTQFSRPEQRRFLPISFFKSHAVQTGSWVPETTFSSSGTTGQKTSQHLVRELDFYLQNTRRGFSHFYGDPSEWAVLALLPSYLERSGSSLVAMAEHFIQLSKHAESGFFLHDFEQLKQALIHCKSKACKTILLGVSFALLDFAEQYPMALDGVTIMETGGMKGRRRELTRTELHETLQKAFGLENIHSEYGMTELFSQAYALGGTRFQPAPTMRVSATELNDPFCAVPVGRTGVLNITDLANLDTCSFIQTEDLGRVYPDGSFEVLGRADTAEMRGCNLMAE